jgi:hypothetical protein
MNSPVEALRTRPPKLESGLGRWLCLVTPGGAASAREILPGPLEETVKPLARGASLLVGDTGIEPVPSLNPAF